MRCSWGIGLCVVLLTVSGCGLTAQGPPPETQICQGWWQWEEVAFEGGSVGWQGVMQEGLSLTDCRAARHQALAAWKELYRFEPHSAGACECKDTQPPKQPDLDRVSEARRQFERLREAINASLYAYSEKINDDFQTQVRTVADLGGFSLVLERREGPNLRAAKYILAMEEIYDETKQMDGELSKMPSRPLRHVDTIVGRLLTSLDRLEEREATVERDLKAYYAVEKFWFGVDEDGLLSGPYMSETAVRGGRPQRLRYVWYLYRPQEDDAFLFFESRERCEAGRAFWQGVGCGEAPTTDMEVDALRRGGRADFKRGAYEKYRLQ